MDMLIPIPRVLWVLGGKGLTSLGPSQYTWILPPYYATLWSGNPFGILKYHTAYGRVYKCLVYIVPSNLIYQELIIFRQRRRCLECLVTYCTN